MLVVLFINEKYYDVRKKQQISSLPVTDRLRIHFLFTLQERPALLECSSRIELKTNLCVDIQMAGKIVIDTERCKGCGLCVVVCPNNCIVISKKSNKNGYFPAQPVPADRRPVESGVEGATNTDCTGCAVCAVICPDVVIEVYREDDAGGKPRKKSNPTLINTRA